MDDIFEVGWRTCTVGKTRFQITNLITNNKCQKIQKQSFEFSFCGIINNVVGKRESFIIIYK
jgi:hypothetical protein